MLDIQLFPLSAGEHVHLCMHHLLNKTHILQIGLDFEGNSRKLRVLIFISNRWQSSNAEDLLWGCAWTIAFFMGLWQWNSSIHGLKQRGACLYRSHYSWAEPFANPGTRQRSNTHTRNSLKSKTGLTPNNELLYNSFCFDADKIEKLQA